MGSIRFGSCSRGADLAVEVNAPTLDVELALLNAGAKYVVGIDEVGRGALAGPVSVGVAVVDATVGPIPTGLADSKLISEKKRDALVPLVQSWVIAYAVGHASPAEIDDVGIIAALRRAAMRALAELPVTPDVAILDGSHDWLTRSDDLFGDHTDVVTPTVHMRVKADRDCASVAAASVLAKVERDALMVALDATFPGYGLADNKGYGSDGHRSAISTIGATEVHRRSWNLTHSD